MADLKSNRLPEPAVKVIGPQLGLSRQDNEIIITIALPHLVALDRLECILRGADGREIGKQITVSADERFRNFIFKFNGLTPDRKYFYIFQEPGGAEISLEGGLSYDDCWFYGPTFNGKTDKFILFSCNNPFHSGYEGEAKQFHMWKRLNERVSDNKDIRLIVQGGDQVYHDRIEKFSLSALKGKEVTVEAVTAVTEEIIKNYQHFYGDLNYRQLLARIPSVAMLDDHDITDGWGGREEGFKKDGDFLDEWFRFFDLAYAAFKAFQACKNPASIYDGAATTYLDIGDNRVFLLDFRSEKNFAKKILISQEHEEAILQLIRETNRRIFLLSPVVPVRLNPDAEERIGLGTRMVFWLNKWLQERLEKKRAAGERAWLSEKAFLLTGAIAAYSDDIYDSLASSVNRPYFLRLVHALKESHDQHENEAIILSGDIHTGGLTEIFVFDSPLTIPQIVSSPIGYQPMPKLVKGVTTTEAEREVKGEATGMTFRNIFFRSDRNFAIITPSRLKNADGIEFHFERLQKPLYSPAYFSQSDSP